MVRTSFRSRSSDLKIMSLKALRNQMPRSDPQKPVMIGFTSTLDRSWKFFPSSIEGFSTSVFFSPTLAAVPLVQSGKLTALAVSSPKRALSLPEVPTTIEAGYPNSDYSFWIGMFVPVKTPRDIVDRLYQAAHKATALKSVQERTAFHVLDVDGKTGELSYYDPTLPNPTVQIKDETTAHQLIARQKEKATGRELYYYFLYPRPPSGFPTLGQERRFKLWFKDVANSLKEGA